MLRVVCCIDSMKCTAALRVVVKISVDRGWQGFQVFHTTALRRCREVARVKHGEKKVWRIEDIDPVYVIFTDVKKYLEHVIECSRGQRSCCQVMEY